MPSDCQFVKSLKTNKATSVMIKINCYVFFKSTDIFQSTSYLTENGQFKI